MNIAIVIKENSLSANSISERFKIPLGRNNNPQYSLWKKCPVPQLLYVETLSKILVLGLHSDPGRNITIFLTNREIVVTT